MAKKEPASNQEPRKVSLEEFSRGWDSERRVHELEELTFTLKASTLYVPAATKADMDEAFGAPTQTIKTRTFPDHRVWIAPCQPDDPDARNLRPTTDTQAAAQVGFAIPIRKLKVRLSPTRLYTFKPERLPVEGGGVVYEISFKEYAHRRTKTGTTTTKSTKARAPRATSKKTRAEAPATPEAPTVPGAPQAESEE